MKSEDPIDALMRAAKNTPSPQPSTALISRVLADAAAMMPVAEPAPKPRFWARIFSPIGGIGGALALAACAAFGVFAGAGYADEMLAIPGLDGVLAGLTDYTDSTTPFDTLALLMTEG